MQSVIKKKGILVDLENVEGKPEQAYSLSFKRVGTEEQRKNCPIRLISKTGECNLTSYNYEITEPMGLSNSRQWRNLCHCCVSHFCSPPGCQL
jgi:hypothetical protein